MTIDYALQIARGETYIQTVDEIDYEREAKDVIFNAIRNGTLLKAQPMNMRDATEEERKSVKDYVDSVSKPTSVNFNELLRDCGTYDCFSRIIDDMYNELPSVTPQRPKGKWIGVGDNDSHGWGAYKSHVCSECKDYYTTSAYELYYCPRCGAYMKEDAE